MGDRNRTDESEPDIVDELRDGAIDLLSPTLFERLAATSFGLESH